LILFSWEKSKEKQRKYGHFPQPKAVKAAGGEIKVENQHHDRKTGLPTPLHLHGSWHQAFAKPKPDCEDLLSA